MRGLTLSTLGKFSADDILKYFLLFSPENRNTHFMQIVSTICMKCQILFSGENITNLSPAELAKTAIKVKYAKNLRILDSDLARLFLS